ncbi:copper-binding protein [Oricola sp.]|uniref:copper-binding protein n=1 Tax=Oricola sp. TaxID=1979950 RepID=UPI00320BEC7F|nr:copper-binding protein [Oricola sp.]
MKNIVAALLAASMALTANAALATEYTKGMIKKVDMKAKKVTIIHEELKNLDMPAMTMVFYPGEEAMLSRMTEGQEIEFRADRVNGKLTVVELK